MHTEAQPFRSAQSARMVQIPSTGASPSTAEAPVPAAHPQAEVVLEVDRLSTHFPLRKNTLKAVDAVRFSLYRGRTTCIVGESGSGKSITARSILNMVPTPGHIVGGRILLHQDSGEIIDLAALHPHSRAIRNIRGNRIAMIFQEPMSSLSPVHTIGAQIVEAIRLHQKVSREEARQRTVALLRRVEIPDAQNAIDRYPFEYSGGMRQRAMIAMALSCRPAILIADEPTTALDVTTQAEILDLIRELQLEFGMAVMFITHDMGVVAEIAEDVVVMRYGQEVEQGPVEQIFHAPEHPYTRTLLESVRRLETPSASKAARTSTRKEDVILSVQGLSMRFPQRKGFFQRIRGWTEALRNCSFELHEGESLGVVGESGSGKTTLARCIASVYRGHQGEIRYRSKQGETYALNTLSTKALRPLRSEIRMIFQDPFASLNPRMTIEQIIGEPLWINGMRSAAQRRERSAEILARVGLPAEIMERYPHAFSGGQRQRIVIARTMVLNPRLVIADEPTSALDVSIRAQVLDLLLTLQFQFGLSFLFITHDMSVVRYFCDRVCVMYQGEIVEIGDTERVVNAPEHPYTRALLSAVPRPDPRRRSIRERVRYRSQSVSEGSLPV